MTQLFGDVIASLGQHCHLGAGQDEQFACFGPAGVSVRPGGGKSGRRFFADRPSVIVGFGLQPSHLGGGPFSQDPGSALGLVQSPLAALEPGLCRQVSLGDDALCMRPSLLSGGRGVLFGRIKNGIRLRPQPLGLGRRLGHCSSCTQGDAGDDVLKLSAASREMDSVPGVAGQAGPFGLDLGRRQKGSDGVLGPEHVFGRVTQDSICILGRGIARGGDLSGGGRSQLSDLCPCVVALFHRSGTRCGGRCAGR